MKRAYATLVVCLFAAVAPAAPKNYKDQGEYEAYSAVAKDMAANDFSKAIAALDAWKQKYPESEYKADRQLLYVQAFVAAKQPGKAVDAAAEVLAGDPAAALGDSGNVIKLLFTTVAAIQQVPDATTEQLAAGGKAAQLLAVYDTKPESVSAENWTQVRGQLQTAARAAQIYVAIVPGSRAMAKKDCASAEAAFTRALETHPDSAQAAWYLGTAALCLYKTQPEKASLAFYEIARASAIDPAKGMVDPTWQKTTVDPYLEKVYTQYHGADPAGLKQLKEIATASPLPPAGFKVKSMTELLQEKQAEFERSNPQLALWVKIKAALADTGGEQYFATNLKDSAVPQLRGVLVDARPACRPKELVVTVPLPDSPLRQPEITLKLAQAVTGKPELNAEFVWEGVPSAFSPNPFMLTMSVESGKTEGLRVTPCAPPVKKAAAKKK